MIIRFLQMWTANRRARLSRAIAGVCVVLCMAGAVSTLYGGLAPQWTTPHCPQSHSTSAHHPHGSCVWHCDGIDTQFSSGRSWRPSITATGFLSGHLSGTLYAPILNGGHHPRTASVQFLLALSSARSQELSPTTKPLEIHQEGCTHERDDESDNSHHGRKDGHVGAGTDQPCELQLRRLEQRHGDHRRQRGAAGAVGVSQQHWRQDAFRHSPQGRFGQFDDRDTRARCVW
jgi:hypothetical protein